MVQKLDDGFRSRNHVFCAPLFIRVAFLLDLDCFYSWPRVPTLRARLLTSSPRFLHGRFLCEGKARLAEARAQEVQDRVYSLKRDVFPLLNVIIYHPRILLCVCVSSSTSLRWTTAVPQSTHKQVTIASDRIVQMRE